MKTLILVLVVQAFFIGALCWFALVINAHDERVRRLAATARSAAKRVAGRGRAVLGGNRRAPAPRTA
jgi:uncharacterized membrane protein